MPRAEKPTDAELHLRYTRGPTRRRYEVYAVSFCAFWRDQFGTVHFMATDDAEWDKLLTGIQNSEIGTFEVDD